MCFVLITPRTTIYIIKYYYLIFALLLYLLLLEQFSFDYKNDNVTCTLSTLASNDIKMDKNALVEINCFEMCLNWIKIIAMAV